MTNRQIFKLLIFNSTIIVQCSKDFISQTKCKQMNFVFSTGNRLQFPECIRSFSIKRRYANQTVRHNREQISIILNVGKLEKK